MGITAEPTDTEAIFEYYALLKYKALNQFKTELATAYDYSDLGVSKHTFSDVCTSQRTGSRSQTRCVCFPADGEMEQGIMSFPDDPYSINGQIEHEA